MNKNLILKSNEKGSDFKEGVILVELEVVSNWHVWVDQEEY